MLPKLIIYRLCGEACSGVIDKGKKMESLAQQCNTSECDQKQTGDSYKYSNEQSAYLLNLPHNSLYLALLGDRSATMFSSAYVAALAVLAQQVCGHGYVNLLKTGGKFYPGWDLNYYYTGTPSGVAGMPMSTSHCTW